MPAPALHLPVSLSSLPLLAAVTAACSSAPFTASPAAAAAADAGDAASAANGGPDASSDASSSEAASSTDASACTLVENTTPTGQAQGGCELVTRDTSACAATRTAAGLGGFWRKFSCRVSLQVAGSSVTVSSDGRPDHESNYFPQGDPCYAPYTPSFPDPNVIAAHALALTVPLAPAQATPSKMNLGAVGMAVDGSAIFDDQAAPGDDIYAEAYSFDRCQGHPAPGGQYHYHTEPWSISYDDAAFIGVMRDGFPIYGRHDTDGSTPKLDASGGHVGTTPDSPATPVYHYHVNLQTSTTGAHAGDEAWFLTTGSYAGAPGSCSGC